MKIACMRFLFMTKSGRAPSLAGGGKIPLLNSRSLNK
jgi:hypothetical protein